jgi:chemotaxis protein CheD
MANPSAQPHSARGPLSPPKQATERATTYLHPGQLFVSADRYAVTTILGSCVAVCLWDPVTQIGGINHFLLPSFSGEGIASPRFGNIAIGALLDQLARLGCQKHNLLAKMFGGACVLEAFRNREHRLGTKNIEAARDLLESEAIPLVGHDVGGQRGRKVIFHTDDGTAWVKPL